MALQFSHAVGYRGYCALYPKTEEGEVPVLCTGGNINLSQDPIMGSGVWGAGFENAAPIAYAWNYLNLQGSVNFELTKGKVWKALREYAFSARTEYHKITLLPDGKNGFEGNGWLSSLSFDASQGAAINGSFNFKGDPSGNNITANGEGDTSSKGRYYSSYGKAVNFAGAMLIPYWMTSVKMENEKGSEIKLDDIISWNCAYNSDIQMLKCCNYQDTAPLSADYILLGQMSGDGSYTIFKLAGDFDPESYHKEKTKLKFTVGNEYIEIPKAIISSGSTSMATGASYITAEYSFTALGDGINCIMSMSDEGGSGGSGGSGGGTGGK